MDELKELLQILDVPSMRRDVTILSNLQWLERNLLINNNNEQGIRALKLVRLLKASNH